MKHAFREFARYASFNALGMLGFSCYILADTFFIAQGLGADGLTALNLAIPIYSLVHGCGLMLGMGGATRYSICRGQQDNDSASAAFVSSVYPAVLLAIIFVSAGLFFPTPLASLLGADAQVLTMTATYLRVILLFSPAFLLNDILVCFVRNDGSPRLSMTAMLAGSFSNIILDYVFIFPCHMGIFGAVLATGLAPCISLVVLSFHRKHAGFGLRRCPVTPSLIGRMLALGLPSLVTELSSGIVILVLKLHHSRSVRQYRCCGLQCGCQSVPRGHCPAHRHCTRCTAAAQPCLRTQRAVRHPSADALSDCDRAHALGCHLCPVHFLRHTGRRSIQQCAGCCASVDCRRWLASVLPRNSLRRLQHRTLLLLYLDRSCTARALYLTPARSGAHRSHGIRTVCTLCTHRCLADLPGDRAACHGLWRCALLAQYADKQARQIKRKTARLSGFFTFCERYQSIFSGGSTNR